jgi:hypothetical protein
MDFAHSRSFIGPTDTALARLLFEATRRAEAMGIVEPGTARAEPAAIRRLADRIRGAGIATSAADVLGNVDAPSREDVRALLQMIVDALEASPAPDHEWKGVSRVFAVDDLAALLAISASSLKRYQSGERETPDIVAARLHLLALVIGDLAGSYNDTGIRRWFQRRRTQLDGQSPAALLKREWDPDEDGPRRVRELARNLVTLSAT